MKHLLTGAAVVAALAIAAPAWAQGKGEGVYPNAPYDKPISPSWSRQAPSSVGVTDSTSAVPPKHRQARKASHGKMAGHQQGKSAQLTGSTANQLNQEELARLQAGNFSNPAAPPGPGMAPPPGGRMPAAGKPPPGAGPR